MYEPILKDKNGKWVGKAHISEKDKVITFPSGAKSKFSYMMYEADADAWYGSELAKVYIDELQHHSEYTFTVLRSRNRSRAKVPKGMRFTLNPDPTHFMFEWISPFLKEDGSGFPDEELGGKTRYFIIKGGDLYTSWDKQELIDKFGKEPQTYTYVPARLEQNEVLKEIDPEYFSVLDSLPEAKRNQLLLGCWASTDDEGVYWSREWLKKADKLPRDIVTARGYDLAGSVPTANYKYPDYTVGIKMSKSRDGYYYIWGDYVPQFKDEGTDVYGRMRRTTGDRDSIILKQALHDGHEVSIVLPQDAGSAGKEAFESKVRYFTEHGFSVKKDTLVSTQKKLTKFEPFASACEHGLVYILEHTFNKETLNWLYLELERFDGERSTSAKKDDAADSCATTFSYLAQSRAKRIVIRNQNKCPTPSNELLSDRDLTYQELEDKQL